MVIATRYTTILYYIYHMGSRLSYTYVITYYDYDYDDYIGKSNDRYPDRKASVL